MNLEDRQKLLNDVPFFVEQVQNIESLVQLLVDEGVLTSKIKAYVLTTDDNDDQKKELLYAITKRGPSAFKSFITCLRKSQNEFIADTFLEHKADVQHGLCVRKGIYKLDHDYEKCYRMRSNPKGYVLLVNVYSFPHNLKDTRLGSDVDVKALDNLWRELGYEVVIKNNPAASDLKRWAKEFSQMEEHQYVDSCIVFVMSHGMSNLGRQGVSIQCSDNMYVHSQDIVDMFLVSNCPLLAEKPKLFFFQACRGKLKEFGVILPTNNRDLNNFSDMNLNDTNPNQDERNRCSPIKNHGNKFDLSEEDCFNISSTEYNVNISENNVDTTDNHIDTSENNVDKTENHIDIPENNVDTTENHIDTSENSADTTENHIDTSEEDNVDTNVLTNGGANGDDVTTDISRWRFGTSATTDDDLLPVSANCIGRGPDILIVYPCQPGYCSLRDQTHGAWMVQEICSVFSENAYHMSLTELLQLVMRNSNKKYSVEGTQFFHTENLNFSKKLYFNPGLYN